MTPAPLALPPLREVISRHGLAARKALGQHFLLDLNLTRRIAAAAGDLSGASVIEVGPGPGGLTRALLETAASTVYAIERDQRCLAALAELESLAAGRLQLIEADALKLDPTTLGTEPRAIVANLPYNISTRLLVLWLSRLVERPESISAMALMFQKEVAGRLTATPSSASYGRLSVLTQWLCEARALFDIPARAFVPPPKVTSSLVLLRPRRAPLAPARLDDLERITAAAFGTRRKMLRQSLRSLGADTPALLARADIDPTARAETLSVEQFCALARTLRELSP